MMVPYQIWEYVLLPLLQRSVLAFFKLECSHLQSHCKFWENVCDEIWEMSVKNRQNHLLVFFFSHVLVVVEVRLFLLFMHYKLM